MRCDQCKHWSPTVEEDWQAAAVGFGLCGAIRARWKIEDEVPACENHEDDAVAEAWSQRRNAALKASRAYVQDGSQYVAELLTGPDFFCALFEQK